jgi:hypothetical protein
VIAVVCWAGPLYQQFFDARPNLSALLRSEGILSGGTVQKTEGWAFGLRALGRAASLNPIWASPRPIAPFTSSSDIAHRSILLGLVVLAILISVAVMAKRHRHPAVLSMCVVSIAGMIGTVVLFSSTPITYFEAFIWINLELWLVGICIWLTLGLAVVVALRPQIAAIRPQIAAIRPEAVPRGSHAARKERRLSSSAKRIGALLALGVACVAGVLVVVFPYGNQFVLDWSGVTRAQHMTSAIEHHVPRGPVGMGVLYTGPNSFQAAGDEHGAAYLLLTEGWSPGMEQPINQLLGMPIEKNGPFVVFTEQGERLVSAQYYSHYQVLWFIKKK